MQQSIILGVTLGATLGAMFGAWSGYLAAYAFVKRGRPQRDPVRLALARALAQWQEEANMGDGIEDLDTFEDGCAILGVKVVATSANHYVCSPTLKAWIEDATTHER